MISPIKLNIITLLVTSIISLISCQLNLTQMIDQKFPAQRRPAPTLIRDHAPRPFQSPTPVSEDPRFDPRSSALVSKSVLKLAHDITEALMQQKTDDKFKVISPLSIAATLSLVLLGAKGNTYNELVHALGYDEDQTLLYSPYKIHEEFGLLLEDLLGDFPSPLRSRPNTPWKGGNRGYAHQPTNRFNFPSDDLQANSMRAALNQDTRYDPNPNNPSNNNQANQFKDIDHKIYVANGIFVQNGYSFRPDYKTAVESVYRSELRTLDFNKNPAEATSYINNWVREKTNGKITNIVAQELPQETKVVLANALYFKAQWEITFIQGATRPKSFYPDGLNGPEVQVDMMAHGGTFPHYKSDAYDCQILGIPYKRNLTTMYVILPNNSSREKLREFQSRMTPDIIDEMISMMTLKTAIILFPKMHLTYSIDLNTILMGLGVKALFNPRLSDLSLISTGYEMYGDAPQISPQLSPQQVQPVQMFASPITQNGEELFIFSRLNQEENDNMEMKAPTKKRDVSYKVQSSFKRDHEPLRLKDYVINKRISKPNPIKKILRNRRQTSPLLDTTQTLQNLDYLRQTVTSPNPGLFADSVLHKVDLTINEKGTEGGAATSISLTKSGTDVVVRVETPFMFLIRHDDTKLPLFYGAVNEPVNNKNFYPDGINNPEIQVEMMAHGGVFPHYKSDAHDCQILGIPYKRNLTTMYVILPNNSSREKLRDFQSRMTADIIEELISMMTPKTAIILMPKMHLTYSIDLNTILMGLGVKALFNPRLSDLSLISTGYEMYGDAAQISPQVPPQQSPTVQMFASPIFHNGEELFVFSRLNQDDDDMEMEAPKTKRDVSYKVESSIKRDHEPLRLKDYVINKRISKPNPIKKNLRQRRQTAPSINTTQILQNLDNLRQTAASTNPGLFVDSVLHKVDLTINEKGTEGGAATTVTLSKTGTDVVFRVETPFMFLIRHDDTKLPLFYGAVNEPENF